MAKKRVNLAKRRRSRTPRIRLAKTKVAQSHVVHSFEQISNLSTNFKQKNTQIDIYTLALPT